VSCVLLQGETGGIENGEDVESFRPFSLKEAAHGGKRTEKKTLAGAATGRVFAKKPPDNIAFH